MSRQKRMMLIATGRRLPWFRRFTLPKPDGIISQADQRHMVYCYAFDIPQTQLLQQSLNRVDAIANEIVSLRNDLQSVLDSLTKV